MGYIIKPLEKDEWVRKDNFAVTTLKELAELRADRVAKIQADIEKIEKRIDEINVQSKMSGVSQQVIDILLVELVSLEDEKPQLIAERATLLAQPFTLGEKRKNFMIIIYADDTENKRVQNFTGFYEKHCARVWKDFRVWKTQPSLKIGTVLVETRPNGLLPPENRPWPKDVRKVIEACLGQAVLSETKTADEIIEGLAVVPLQQPVPGVTFFARKYDFDKEQFVDQNLYSGGFKFTDVHRIRTKKDWANYVERNISKNEFQKIWCYIENAKKPNVPFIYGEVWFTGEYFPVASSPVISA